MGGHAFEDREDGLACCTVCGGAEGTLTSDCPGYSIDGTLSDDIYAGKIDFVDGVWTTVQGHEPSRIRRLANTYPSSEADIRGDFSCYYTTERPVDTIVNFLSAEKTQMALMFANLAGSVPDDKTFNDKIEKHARGISGKDWFESSIVCLRYRHAEGLVEDMFERAGKSYYENLDSILKEAVATKAEHFIGRLIKDGADMFASFPTGADSVFESFVKGSMRVSTAREIILNARIGDGKHEIGEALVPLINLSISLCDGTKEEQEHLKADFEKRRLEIRHLADGQQHEKNRTL